VTTAAVSDAGAVGKHLWLGFKPVLTDDNEGDFVRIDEVHLVAIPEPATLTVAALGLLGLASRRRRRKR